MKVLAHKLAMSDAVHHGATSPKNDSVTFVGIFFVSFIVFLTIALCAQMVALPWRSWLPGAEGRSLVGGVRTSVYTFMSYLN